eukprot:Em0006g95a
MSLHASGALPGQLVANTRQASHLQHCPQSLTNQIAHLQSSIAPEPQINQNLPTFEEVCQLHHPTLRFVPTKARPAFARALSTALKEVLRHNSEEAWLKLFMLPNTTLNLLQSKNPSCPHPTIPDIDSNPVTLGPSFDILDMSNAFNRVSRQAVVPPSLNCYHGYHGAMVLTPFCGNPWAKSAHSQLVSSIEADDDCLSSACAEATATIDVPDPQWQQAQLSPKLGGLGLRSLSLHSCAAFISSVASLEMGNPDNTHLQQAILRFNARVSPQDSITMESVLNSPPQQKSLSQKLDSFAFHSLLSSASLVNKARMLSVSSPHTSSWITAIPSTSLKLHLDSAEYQTAIRWWLGLNTSEASPCPFCPELVLDPLGHHAASCRHGGDVVTGHNRLRDIFVEFCRQAHLSVRVEAGFGLSRVQRNTHPADVLVQDWVRGSPAAIDITVTSPLTPAMLRDASTSAGSAAYAAECRKHEANDTKCQELRWTCIPLAVETFGHWGKEAQAVFSRLASFIAIHRASPKSSVLNEMYSRLNMSLVRSVARAILVRGSAA